jgi:hypothetical protein
MAVSWNINMILISKEDQFAFDCFTWYISKDGYVKSSFMGAELILSREVLNLGASKKYADHIDGNKLNNKRDNLRPVSPSQNMFNRKKQSKKSTSKYKGVYFCKQRNMWRVRIWSNKKMYCIGFFECEHEAGFRYNEKALELFGEYARLNNVVEFKE